MTSAILPCFGRKSTGIERSGAGRDTGEDERFGFAVVGRTGKWRQRWKLLKGNACDLIDVEYHGKHWGKGVLSA